MSWGSMQHRRRDWWLCAPSVAHLDVNKHLNVAENILRYRLWREWVVIRAGAQSPGYHVRLGPKASNRSQCGIASYSPPMPRRWRGPSPSCPLPANLLSAFRQEKRTSTRLRKLFAAFFRLLATVQCPAPAEGTHCQSHRGEQGTDTHL